MKYESQKLDLTDKEKGEYTFNNTILELHGFPVIIQGKPVDLMSERFLKKLAQGGKAKFSAGSISNTSQGLNNVQVILETSDQSINLSNLSFEVLDSRLNGNGSLSFKNQIPKWAFQIQSDKINLQPISELLNTEQLVQGYISINSQIDGVLQDSDIKFNSGNIHIQGSDLDVSSMDIDKVLENSHQSQSIDLLDVGAVALLGPGGIIINKSDDYQRLMNDLENKGKSRITQLNINVSLTDGVASMNDVAFATEKNRLAVRGKIDTNSGRFIAFKVATIDKNGCAVYEEEISGTLASPVVKDINVLMGGVVNPIGSLVFKVTDALGIGCNQVFYNGSVKSSSQ